MSDVFETLKNGSEGHRAELLSDGWWRISTHSSADKDSLVAFQQYALMAIEAERSREIEFLKEPHPTSRCDDEGRPLYDQLIIRKI
jgi:hypothetical protein